MKYPIEVLIGLRVPDKASLLATLARHAAQRAGVKSADLLQLLQAREGLGSTGVGNGIALPHARLDGLASGLRIFARLNRAIPYDAIDAAPVDLVLLLLSPLGDDRGHLQALAAASRRLRDRAVAEAIRRAPDRDAIALLLNQD